MLYIVDTYMVGGCNTYLWQLLGGNLYRSGIASCYHTKPPRCDETLRVHKKPCRIVLPSSSVATARPTPSGTGRNIVCFFICVIGVCSTRILKGNSLLGNFKVMRHDIDKTS